MRRAPFAAVVFAVLLAGCSSAVDAEDVTSVASAGADPRGGVPQGYSLDRDVLTPLVITMLEPDPVPVTGTDGKVHVAYEMQMLNVTPRPVTISKVETLADGPDGKVVTSMDQAEVTAQSIQFPGQLAADAELGPGVIAAGRTVVLLVDDVYDSRDDVPAGATHRVSATLGAATPGSEALGAMYPDTVAQIGGAVRTGVGQPVIIGPPVAGDGWIASNGCCVMSPHRGTVMPLGSRLNGAERYAIDWIRINPANQLAVGDGSRNEDYYAYNSDLLAVADGTVVAAVSDMPDVPPMILPAGVPVDQMGGNHVIIDIGDGNFAFYAHLIPGSATVKVGDKVTRGQVIGKLGNSGNTTAPHVHFHVSRAPMPLSGDNVPYEIDTLAFVGTVAEDVVRSGDGIAVQVTDGPDAGERKNQLPLYSTIISFPANP